MKYLFIRNIYSVLQVDDWLYIQSRVIVLTVSSNVIGREFSFLAGVCIQTDAHPFKIEISTEVKPGKSLCHDGCILRRQ